jgi:type VI protein secretion system component Hcp
MKFTIEHYSDATTPSWAESLLKGTQVASVFVLGINSSSALPSVSNSPNVTIVLANPVVVSVSTSANDGKPIETVSMTYQRVTIVDNTVSPPVTINWME